MNGFAFCETDSKRHARQHRYRLHDLTKCLIVNNMAPKCESSDTFSYERWSNTSIGQCDLPNKCNHQTVCSFSSGYLWSAKAKQTLIIVALCCICYYNALPCDFAFDDMSAIKENKDLRPETPISELLWDDFWGQPMMKEHSHKSYRPVCVFTFRLNYALHQLRPFGYHLVNVLLHIIVCVLYFRFCRLIVSSECAFLAGILFSVHPVHTEAVTSVVGRAETLSATFYLLAVLVYSRATQRRSTTNWSLLMCSIACTCLATFSKEQGITSLALCCTYELVCNQKLHQWSFASMATYIGHKATLLKASGPKWIKEMTLRIALLALAALLMIAVRLRVMHSQLPVFTRFDNPAAYAGTPVRQMTHHYLLAVNAWLLFYPMHLCCDWTMGTIPLVESLLDPRNAATAVLYLILGTLACRAASSRHRMDCAVISISLSMLILSFLPASNLFFYVGFVIAERILYIPSFGFCLLIAYGICKLSHRISSSKSASASMSRFILSAIFFVMVASHCGKTILRNQDWSSEMNIFSSGIRVNPRNAKLFNNVGHVLESENRYFEALDYFLKATKIQPDDLGAYLNVGRTYAKLSKFDLAEDYFRKAKALLLTPEASHNGSFYARIAPSHLSVFINLGNLISQNKSRLAEAEQLYRQAIQMRPDYVEAYINRAEILLKMNRSAEAEKVYMTALHFDNQNPDIYYNLGVVAIESGKLLQALAYFDAAIRINPHHPQALLNFAIVVQDAGKTDLLDLAESRLKLLLELGHGNERVYFHLGMISMNSKRHQQAEKWFTNAIQMRPDFRSATFNLALLLTNTGRPLVALPHLQQLVKHHPDHLKGLSLLCDILINHAKDMVQAESCYHQILRLSSRNIQAKHNLCVVYVEQGLLDKAEQCLLEAAQLSPHQEYVDRHLKIVRLRIVKLRKARQAIK